MNVIIENTSTKARVRLCGLTVAFLFFSYSYKINIYAIATAS